MKQILCVVDFSNPSVKVLEVAGKIAAACGAHLHVLYPYRLIDHNHRGDMTSLRRKLESHAIEKFHELRRSLPGLSTPSCEFQPEIGFMSDRINAHLLKNEVDMIIIGQDQVDSSNDIRSFDLQGMIRYTQLPFVIVPAEVRTETNLQMTGSQ